MAKTSKILQSSKLFVAFLFLFISKQALSVRGWAIGPAKYVFSIENAMDNGIMNVHCNSENDDIGLVRLPVNSNYTHGFTTQMFKTISFFCELMIPSRAFKVFDTFRDVVEFVDRQCGGRHCFWKATEKGIYLYHIQKHKYYKKFEWSKYPPNKEDLKKLDEFDDNHIDFVSS
ncbi:S-protein homolog 3-like [Chenopodium quinoa]|uniref:S-protein homolog 3-like n=1 Tax=Chenopodium quinoa TaxID=63459 RepID=UPI000B779E96|nr:S-protein homolog 3-like [Chenopodium quinoa]